MELYSKLLENNIKKENILIDEPMSKHTSFKTGGKADFFIRAYSIEEIQTILKIAKGNAIPLFVIRKWNESFSER